jgi:protein required for attachment to host cells
MRAKRTWVLIADGGRARILENDGPGHGLKAVEGMTFSRDLPPTHELVRDRQPRSYESTGHMRHPIEVGEDPHRKQKAKFAAELASVLDRHAADKSFDRLVIVAPAKALGDLRSAFTDQVRRLVYNEVIMDLTKTPNEDVAAHLDGVLVL